MSSTGQAPRGELPQSSGGQTTEVPPASIAEAFDRIARSAPERLCLHFEGEDWSYGRQGGRAETFAAALRAWGLRPRERVAAVVVRDNPDLSAEEIVNFCRQDLAGFKKPRQVVFVDALPRNALGKVLKHVLRKELIEAEE